MPKLQNGYDKDVTYPSEALCGALRKSAARLGMPLIEGAVHSSDVFYRDAEPDYWEKLRDEKGCLAVEMEKLCAVPQCGRHEKKRRVPAHNFRQLCIP